MHAKWEGTFRTRVGETGTVHPDQADLVETVREAGVGDDRLLQAFAAVPRAGFVSASQIDFAYEDRPLPIPHRQVTTQPSLSAFMIEALAPQPGWRVLEIGTGYGFQTALLAHLSGHVTSIETWPDLAAVAGANLRCHGIHNVDIVVGDGSLGLPDAAPFDAVLVSAAFTEVPPPLGRQLVEGGRLVQPIGPGGDDVVTLFRKQEDRLVPIREVIPAYFVRLVGRRAFPGTHG